MLYPNDPNLLPEENGFRDPPSAYRGTPFWAWNGKLNKETLLREIDEMRKMGFGGFHMHVRTGMDTPYLEKDFFDFQHACVEHARQNNMLAWLYDEDRWPSGAAGGKVTEAHPEYAMKHLLFTAQPYEEGRPNLPKSPVPGNGCRTLRMDNGELLAVYDVVLNPDGTLHSAKRIGENDEAEGRKWYAYEEHAMPDPWFNDQAYLDTLDPEAVRCFIETTHEAYAREFGDDFGKLIPAIFTDEPQFAPKDVLAFSTETKDVFFPWTRGFAKLYEDSYHESLLDHLPELIWEKPDGEYSLVRYRFHDLIASRFVEAYSKQIGNWCDAHHLRLTGHVNNEPTLESQTQAVGDAMRSYPYFGIPGIDMLCDWHEYNTAKQTQSMVRQTGKEGMLSELYGVTGWDCDFRTYKLQGDWQAALGVTVRVPHLFWMTMKGEAKRDYPASIGPQSPWWEQFSMIEDHFARLNTVLTRGKADCGIAVIHPIESFWMLWGPEDKTGALRRRMDERFMRLTQSLLFGLVDFDFIDEASLPMLCKKGGAPLAVGKMQYDTVIVSGSITLRGSTVQRLEAFKNDGGKLILLGDAPSHMDGMKNDRVKDLFDGAIKMGFDPEALLATLQPVRKLDVFRQNGTRTDNLIHQFRTEGDRQWLFIANGKNPVSPDVEKSPLLRFVLRGEYTLTRYDTRTGETEPLPSRYENGNTVFERLWYMHDSLLLRLEKGRSMEKAAIPDAHAGKMSLLTRPVDIHLSEPNMLLLDMAEWAADGGEYRPLEELLRMDNAVRAELGIPLRRKEVLQPYKIKDEVPTHSLKLRFVIPSKADIEQPMLGLEDAAQTKIVFNGIPVESVPRGWFVDRCIETISLPPIHKGENVLEITVPIGRRTNLEYFYLLGDFGVQVNGTVKTITEPVRSLGFGDVTSQGLPFYTGNIDYTFDVTTGTEPLLIRVPRWRGGLVSVRVDGIDRGRIAFSPYTCAVPGLTPGRHTVTLRLYGTRQNGFAQLHHTPGVYFYQSPNSWRSTGDLWNYEYVLKPMGILKSPELYGTYGPVYATKAFDEPGAMDD